MEQLRRSKSSERGIGFKQCQVARERLILTVPRYLEVGNE